MASLATLWVNIVPTVKGLRSAVQKGMQGADSDATSTGASLGNSLKSAFSKVVAGIGAAAIGKKILDLGKEALSAYSDYEQFSGGIAKLFGNMNMSVQEYAASQNKSVSEVSAAWSRNERAQAAVMRNAQQAYKTTGQSANEYMQQATTMSSALINSLGGDTEKAAKYVDVAMRAISDNVNTFGSDSSLIAYSIQGIAKQNYTMLDNLNLGYAGTKAGMQELIDDANAWGAANGEASDLSIDSFADCVQAIQQVQEAHNVAGTTAREASTTIEGSIKSLKAAWENLFIEVGKNNGDVKTAVQNLCEAGLQVLRNVVPRVGVIISGALSAVGLDGAAQLVLNITSHFDDIYNRAKAVFDQVSNLISQVSASAGMQQLSAAFDMLWDAIKRVADVVGSNFGTVVGQIKDLATNAGLIKGDGIQGLADTISGALSGAAGVVKSVSDSLKSISDWCTANAAVVQSALVGIGVGLAVFKVSSFITTVVAGLKGFSLATTAAAVAQAAFNVVAQANPFVLLATLIAGVVAALVWFFTQTNQGKAMWQSFCGALSSAWQSVCNFFSAAITNIKTWFSNAGTSIKNTWNNVVNAISGIPGRIASFFNGIGGRIGSKFSGVKDSVLSFFGNAGSWLRNAGSSIMNGFLNGLKSAWNAVKNFVGSIGDWIKEHKGPISYDRVLLTPAGEAIMTGFAKGLRDSFGEVKKTIGGITAYTAGAFDGIDPQAQLTADMSKTGRTEVTSAINANVASAAQSSAATAGDFKQAMIEALQTMPNQTLVLDTGVVAGAVNRRLGSNMNRGL